MSRFGQTRMPFSANRQLSRPGAPRPVRPGPGPLPGPGGGFKPRPGPAGGGQVGFWNEVPNPGPSGGGQVTTLAMGESGGGGGMPKPGQHPFGAGYGQPTGFEPPSKWGPGGPVYGNGGGPGAAGGQYGFGYTPTPDYQLPIPTDNPISPQLEAQSRGIASNVGSPMPSGFSWMGQKGGAEMGQLGQQAQDFQRGAGMMNRSQLDLQLATDPMELQLGRMRLKSQAGLRHGGLVQDYDDLDWERQLLGRQRLAAMASQLY